MVGADEDGRVVRLDGGRGGVLVLLPVLATPDSEASWGDAAVTLGKATIFVALMMLADGIKVEDSYRMFTIDELMGTPLAADYSTVPLTPEPAAGPERRHLRPIRVPRGTRY